MHTTVPARERAQIRVSAVSLTRGTTQILRDVSLSVGPTSRIAIVGENGRGKTSLLHVLSGRVTPDAGDVRRVGTIGVADQDMATAGDLTVGDAIASAIAAPLDALATLDAAALDLADGEASGALAYAAALERAEALGAWDAERRVEIALESLNAETDRTRLLADLSVGQRYRVRLACLLGADDDFLLLDEPTNHLDRSALDFLTARLRERRGAVVIVSHDRALLADVAETLVDLDPSPDGRPRVYGNGFEGYRQGRVAERERWELEYAREQAEHARLQESLSAAQNRLVSGWRPEKGSPKHGRATRAGSLVSRVHRRQEALEAHAITVPEPPLVFRFPDLPVSTGATLVTAEGLSVEGRQPGPVSFALTGGGRLVVTGPNGAGKSTLLSVLAGELEASTGRVRVPRNVRLGFLRQETAASPEKRANEVYAQHIDTLVASGVLPESDVVGLSQLGLLRTRDAGARVADLSMGQRRRLDLALVLAARPHVLLLDEPTNHLSIALVEELAQGLEATPAAVVVSTHDRQLLRDLSGWPQLRLEAAGA